MTNGRPRNDYRRTLRAPTKHDYFMLVHAAVKAILMGHVDIILVTSYLTKYPDDFPKGIAERDGTTIRRRIKAKKLLLWLNKHGHTDITMEMMRAQQISFTKQFGERI